ncbi:MAG: GLUG motif-containing protein, partial [Bacteroides sp.]
TVSAAEITPSEPQTDTDGVYQIGTKEELYWFAGLVNGTLSDTDQNQSAKAVLTADIVVNEGDVAGCNGEKDSAWVDWVPIMSYTGTFDGKNHTVSGIYVNDSTMSKASFFGEVKTNGTVKNTGVINSYISGATSVGGVSAYVSKGIVSNCFFDGVVLGSGNNVGGVCGYNFEGTVSNCYNKGSISVSSQSAQSVGGVCGYMYGAAGGAKIENCYSTGSVSGTTNYIGSVCGQNVYGTVTNCYYNKDVCEIGGINNTDTDNQAVGKTQAEFDDSTVCGLLGYHSFQNDRCYLCGAVPPPESAQNTDWNFSDATGVIYGNNNNVLTFKDGENPDSNENQQYWNWKFEPASYTNYAGEPVTLDNPVFTLKDGCEISLSGSLVHIDLPADTTVKYSGNSSITIVGNANWPALRNIDSDSVLTFEGENDAKLKISSGGNGISSVSRNSKLLFDKGGTVEIISKSLSICINSTSSVNVTNGATLIAKTESTYTFNTDPVNIAELYFYEKDNSITEDSTNYKRSIIKSVPYYEEPMTSWSFTSVSETIYGKSNNKLTYAIGVNPEDYAEAWNWKFEPKTETTKPVFTLKDGFDVTLNSEWQFPADTTVNYSGSCKLNENGSNMMRFGGNITFHGTDANSIFYVKKNGYYTMYGNSTKLLINGNGTVDIINYSAPAIDCITTFSVEDNAVLIATSSNTSIYDKPVNSGITLENGYYTKKEAPFVIEDVTYGQSIIKGNVTLNDHHFDENGFCDVEDCLRGLNGESEYLPAVDNNGVYEISKPGQLFWFAEKVNNAYAANPSDEEGISLKAVLMNDIAIPAGRQWTPVEAYMGTFDGNGHTISGMNVEIPGDTAGMFLQNGGTIKHLGIIDSSFATVGEIQGQSSTTGMLGAVAGFSYGTIEDCYSRNITFSESDTPVGSVCVGGIVGHIVDDTVVKNCYSAGLIFSDIETSPVDSNGIVGLAMGTYTIENCYYEANENFNKTVSGATSKTSEEFASGEITSKLNGDRTGADAVWGQKLGENGDA